MNKIITNTIDMLDAVTYLTESVQNVDILPGSEVNQDIALNSDPG